MILLGALTNLQIGLIAGGGGLALILIIVIAVLLVKRSKRYTNTTEKIKVKGGVRYTVNQNVTEASGQLRVSHLQGDVTLERGKEYTVRKGGRIIPGKYTVLAANEEPLFNLRIGAFVREFEHNSGVVLAEGDKIVATSHTVILR